MMTENRVSEILDSLESFSKDAYGHKDMLGELLELQDEIVSITFNEKHAASANLKIRDVVKHLEALNKQTGYSAGRNFASFKASAKTMEKQIKAAVSDKRGEYMTYTSLRRMKTDSRILKNIELGDDPHAEFDAIVIKSGQISIIEVKNTNKDVFISESSDYYATGCYLKKEYNICDQLDVKQRLVKSAIADLGLPEVPIKSYVVFTNDAIEVSNKSPRVKTLLVGQLSDVLDKEGNNEILSETDMRKIESGIKDAEVKSEYPADFDVQRFKYDFATVMAKLESSTDYKTEEAHYKKSIWFVLRKHMRPFGVASVSVFVGVGVARSIRHIRSRSH